MLLSSISVISFCSCLDLKRGYSPSNRGLWHLHIARNAVRAEGSCPPKHTVDAITGFLCMLGPSYWHSLSKCIVHRLICSSYCNTHLRCTVLSGAQLHPAAGMWSCWYQVRVSQHACIEYHHVSLLHSLIYPTPCSAVLLVPGRLKGQACVMI
jgi:hypothetical protein